MTPTDDAVVRWLLDGDVAIRWQVLRDLVGAPESAVGRERQKVAREGWGARLLALQDPEGTWDGGLYSPKWTSTTYTMLLLRDCGLPPSNPQARRACSLLLDNGLRSDGGWNCRRPHGARHSSVHTTISVLEGLRLYGLSRRRMTGDVQSAQGRGREFLRIHRLFRSHRTSRIIKSEFTRFSFPPRWHYDILRALDHFQVAGAPRDPRLSEAMAIVRRRRRSDGRWPLQNYYKGKSHFVLERLGAPSRWNTLRALRVLKWWEHGDAKGVGRTSET